MEAFFDKRPDQWGLHAREVVREIDRQPHLLVRVTVEGGVFPHRAMSPVMRIVGRDESVLRSWFTEISNDGRALLGYFPTDPPEGVVEFGYDGEPLMRVTEEFHEKAVERLDRARLDEAVVETSNDYLARKRGF